MIAETKGEVIDGQTDFSGGMNLITTVLADNQYRYAENFIVRNGTLTTRGGINRAYPITNWWWHQQFFFNAENAKFRDATHTGFWFPFDFGNTPTIQGALSFRFPSDSYYRQIIVADEKIWIYDNGVLGQMDSEDPIASTDDCRFIMANNYLVMLRGQGKQPLKWYGNATGFVKFTQAGDTNRIPLGYEGAYSGGRLAVVTDRSDIRFSDIFDIDTYDEVYQQFSVARGDGDEIVKILPFSGDHMIVFKKRSTHALSGLAYAGTSGGYTGKLADYVGVENIFGDTGLVGKNAYAVHGENITWLSYKGIVSLRRSSEGKVLGVDVALSDPIKPLIDRINWTYAYKACGIFFNNYILFGVPLDSSKINNAVLVYDLQANGGQGAWVSVWKSPVLEPINFFVENEKLYFVSEDGGVRQMFTDDPWDSNSAFYDTKLHDKINVQYYKDDLVKWTNVTTRYYKCLVDHINQELTNTTYWQEQTDPEHLYDITSKIWTRFYRHQDITSPKRYSRCQIYFAHENPKVSIDIQDEHYLSIYNLFTDVVYNRLAYDVDNRANWVDDNSDEDWDTQGRQDYAMVIPYDSFFVPAFGGLYLGVKEFHDIRFIPRIPNNTAFSLLITNKRGKIDIRSILNKAKYSAFARRNI